MHALPGLRPVCCLLLVAFLSPVVAQQISSGPAQPVPEPGTATITVSVTDHAHKPVMGLQTEDFALHEDGRPLLINEITSADVPACIGLLVDQSGSMRHELGTIASAIGEFVRAGNAGNQVFLVLFNDSPVLQQDFTSDPALIEKALALADARGGTAFYDALIAAADHLAENKTCSKRVLLAVTDGYDNESRKTREYALNALRGAGNPLVYSIGLPNSGRFSPPGRQVLELLAARSGGAAFFAGNPGEMHKAALKIVEDLKCQYRVSYTARLQPGDPNIKIVVHAPDRKNLTVRMNVAGVPGTPAFAPDAPAQRGECISGSVVDEHEKPVAGTEIEGWPLFVPNSSAKDPRPTTTADESGKFKLGDLQPGRYQLYTRNESAGYPPTKNSFYRNAVVPMVQTSKKCANVVVKLGPKAARLKVNAVDATSGASISIFGIRMRDTYGYLTITRTTAGQEVLVPPNAELAVVAWAYRYPLTQPLTIRTPGPEASLDVTLQLQPGGPSPLNAPPEK